MPLLIAARSPLALLVLAVALVTGLVSAIWLLPLGLVAYICAVVLAARDPSLAVAAERSARRAAAARIESPTFRGILAEIDRSQHEVERSVGQAQGPLLRLLTSVSSQTRDLTAQAHDLAQKGAAIEQYLATINYPALQRQIDQLDAQVTATSDPYTVQQLQETRKAIVDRKNNAQALETYIGRIMAQLQNIDANLDNILAETVRLRTADAVSIDSMSSQVSERLRDLNADMDAFQKVLDTALTQTGAP